MAKLRHTKMRSVEPKWTYKLVNKKHKCLLLYDTDTLWVFFSFGHKSLLQ